MNKEREQIIQKLMHEPGMTFNQLWDHIGASNKFAYHLGVLEEDGLVEKSHEGYQLTQAGKKYVAYVEGATGKKSSAPLFCAIIVLEKDGKVLLNQRTKEPFYGFWAFPAGKMKMHQYILETAADELKEETGLACDLELKGLQSIKTYHEGEIAYNHQLFVVRGLNPTGTLLESTREGKNQWVAIEEIKDLKTFPNIFQSIEIALGKHFRWIETERLQENDKFKDVKVLKDVQL